MDLHRRPDRGTIKLAGRVRGNTQVSSRANLPLRRAKRATTKTRKDSAAIMRRIEETLRQPRYMHCGDVSASRQCAGSRVRFRGE
eukprot:7525058-Pyramimonas_sp.AAC.1